MYFGYKEKKGIGDSKRGDKMGGGIRAKVSPTGEHNQSKSRAQGTC